MSQDIYRELASIRAHAQANTFFNAWQTGLLSEMDASMQSIHNEMAEARQLQMEGLAAQQEMLQREQLQGYLEEFVYQTEKLVAECKNPKTKLLPSCRYFTLLGIIGRIKEENICTPIIRGRDNKAAFDRVVSEIKSLATALKQDPEVKQAIVGAQAEQKRLADERRRNATKRRAELNATIQRLQEETGALDARVGQGQSYWNWVAQKCWKGKLGCGSLVVIIPIAFFGATIVRTTFEQKEASYISSALAFIIIWFVWTGLCYGVARLAGSEDEERIGRKRRRQIENKLAELATARAELEQLGG